MADDDNRLSAIESRLSRLESYLRIGAAQAQPVFSSPRPAASELQTDQSVEPDNQIETARPGNWLGVIAVLCFVLAAGFIIKLSIESGWLTPTRQIGIAAVLGCGLIGTGLALLRADRHYAAFLPGAGIIVLYLSAFAAHRFYNLIPFDAALGATTIVSALCVWLQTRIRHDVYPLVAAIGAYLSPFLLGLNSEAVFSIYYVYACSMAFAVIAVWLRSRALILISSYLAIAVTAMIGLDLNQNALIAAALGLHFTIFAAVTFFYSRAYGDPLGETESWGFFPVLLVFYTAEYYYIDHAYPGLAPWILMMFAAGLVGLYMLARRFIAGALDSRSLVAAFAAVTLLHSFYFELLPDGARPWLFVAAIAAAIVWTLRQNTEEPFEPSGSYFIPMLAIAAVMIIGYYEIILHLLKPTPDLNWCAVAIFSVAGLWSLRLVRPASTPGQREASQIVLGLAHILAIVGLYRLGTDHGSLAVSALWLLYGAVTVGVAFFRKDNILAKSALFVLGFAAGKALLYDAAAAPTFVRILCLLLTGAVLYACGFFIRQIGTWQDEV